MITFKGENRILLSDAILRTVAYEDVFDYPVTGAEIHRFLAGVQVDYPYINEALRHHPRLSLTDGFYTLPGRECLAAVRRKREQNAARWWTEALRYGRLIARLPFVRMLAVTGSLAMNNVDQNPDIDYLVVTVPGHLWTTRAVVLAVARAAAWRGVRLCPNYFISERALDFPDQNLYTAHELVQMVPLSGLGLYADIRKRNAWTERFLPNAGGLPPLAALCDGPDSRSQMQSFLEAGLRLSPGTWFEHWEMERKIRMLSDHQDGNSEVFFSAEVCKGHINRHEKQTEQVFSQRLSSLCLEPYP